ncbi:DEAD/DEAH box helicase [Vibrio chagasii]|nr:DEAD/DEAH box helicase [Vibrio chagasii]
MLSTVSIYLDFECCIRWRKKLTLRCKNYVKAVMLRATPGRPIDLYNQNAVRFDQLEILVLDEADRMLDMGFIRDIRCKILAFST